MEANQTIGGVPLTVSFAGRNSLDYDADSLAFTWSFEADSVQSTEPNPTYTFAEPGTYRVRLTVEDPDGEASTTETEVLVGNDLPQLSWNFTGGNQTFYWPDQPLALNYAVSVSDAEDGSLAEGTIDPERVTVSFSYLPEGSDRVMGAKDHATLADASMVKVGERLIDESDCRSCHHREEKSVGPAYLAIAERYQGDAQAPALLANKIIRGGGGQWGEVAMAAHPETTPQQARQMVNYILSLSESAAPATSYPPQGTYTSEEHQQPPTQGSYVLTASYTDQGGQRVGPLTTQQTLMLRHPRVEAESYDEGSAPKYPVKAADTPGVDEDMTVVIGQRGKYFAFRDIDLTGVTAVQAQFGLAPGITKGGRVEYRLNGPDGELLGSTTLKQGLTDLGFQEPVVTIEPTAGRQDIYVVFANDEEDSDVLVTVVNWIEFLNKEAS